MHKSGQGKLCQVPATGFASLCCHLIPGCAVPGLSLITMINIFLTWVSGSKIVLNFPLIVFLFGGFLVFFRPAVNLDFQEYPSIVLPHPPPATNMTWRVPEGHWAPEKSRSWELLLWKAAEMGNYCSEKQQSEELLLRAAAGVGTYYNHPEREQLALWWPQFSATFASLRQFHQN